MAKGAIDLVVTEEALKQVRELNAALKEAAANIATISKTAIKTRDTGTSAKLTAEMREQKRLTNELERAQAKLNNINSDAAVKLRELKAKLENVNKSMRKGAAETENMAVRVKSFFKTLVLFDLARRAVDAFWGSFKKGFDNLKKLDSIRLQFKYIVNDANETAATMAFLTRISNQYGAELLALSERYIKFRAASKQANLSGEETRNIFESVTKAAGVLGLKTDELSGVYLALEQMLSKGKVTTEELRRQLGERLPGAFGIMAKALGVTTQQLDDMLKKGEVLSSEALPKFAKELEKAYGIENVKNVDTLIAATVRLDNAFTTAVQNMEGGSSRISKALIVVYDIARELTKQFGELFLTIEEKGKIKTTFGFEEGTKNAQKTLEEFDQKYGETMSELKRTQIGWQVQFEIEGMTKAKKELAELQKQLNSADTPLNDIPKIAKDILYLNRQIGMSEGFIFGMNKEFEKTEPIVANIENAETRNKETLQDYLDLRRGLLATLQSEVSVLQTRQKYTNDTGEIKLIEQQIKGINDLSSALKSGNFSDLDFGNEALQDLLTQLDMSDPLMANMIRNQIRIAEEMDNMAKATEGATENIMTFNDWLMVYGDTAMAFSDMTNAIYERQIQNIEDELDALDDSYNHKKELLELEVGDEEAKNERLRQLEIEKFQEEQKMQKKLAEARKKQAIIDKAAALFNIAINTLVAVSRAPAEAGPFLGIYLATWLKIQGALAAAAVLAQPVPKYKEGHLSGTHEGAAIVGDGGRSEVIQRKDGTFALTPNKSTLTYMKRGDKVHKSIDSFIDTLPQKSILSAANNAAMFASLSGDLLPKKETFDNSFKEQLKEEIVKSLSGIKIYNNDRAVGDAVAQALKDNMYRNKFL